MEMLRIRERPAPGEIFSSWMAREAQALGKSLNGLINYVYRDWLYKKRDIDKFATGNTINKFADLMNVDILEAEKTSLYMKMSTISNIEKHPYSAEWVTHTNNIYTARKTNGNCFCPTCLSEDKVPYFRLAWRISFVTMCTEHDELLHDKCHNCKNEINLYRLPAGRECVTRCCWCDHDIRKSPKITGDYLTQYKKAQNYLCELLNKTTCGEKETKNIREYFKTLYYFLYMVTQQCNLFEGECRSLPEEISYIMGKQEKHAYFDAYSVAARMVLLERSFSLFNQVFKCNFKEHARLVGTEKLKNIRLVKQIPCTKWCEKHDYLSISKSCEHILEKALQD